MEFITLTRLQHSGVPVDLDPTRFGSPDPNPLADLGGGGALIQDLAGGEGSNFQRKPTHLSWPMLRHLRFTRVFLSRLSAVDE